MKRVGRPGIPWAAGCALAAAGAATGAGFLPGGPWWLPWLSCAPLFVLTAGKSPAQAFRRGWLFGAAVWAAGIYWLPGPLALFLGVSFPAALALFALVCAWHGLIFALLAVAAVSAAELLRDRMGWPESAALLCAVLPAMTVLEEFFPKLFQVYLAGTQAAHLPAVQILELTGPAGVTWLVLGFNIAVSLLARAIIEGRSRRAPAALLAAFCALALLNEGYGRLRLRQLDGAAGRSAAAERTLGVAVLQASVPLPPGGGGEAALTAYRDLTALAGKEVSPGLVVWPESAYGRVAEYSAAAGKGEAFSESFRRTLKRDIPGNFTLLINSRAVPAGSGGPAVNAAYSADQERRLLGLSAKRRLFPFGEYMPFGRFFPGLYRFSPRTAAGLKAGAESRPLPAAGGSVGVMICYEGLYPQFAAELARKGADLLVELSNGEGFGAGTALEQHLAFSSLRAVETRRFFVRAANTGISAVVDPAGRVVSSLGPGRRSYLYARVALGGPRTFYSRHERLFRLSGLFILSALFAVAAARRGGRKPEAGGETI